MDENKKNVKYAGQLIDVARQTTRLVVDDMLRAMDDKDGDPFLNVFSKSSIYRMTLIDLSFLEEGQNRRQKKILLSNIPLPDLAIIEEHTKLAERIIFDNANACGFSELKSEVGMVKKAITKLYNLFNKNKTASGPTPLTDEEIKRMNQSISFGKYKGKTAYAALLEDGEAAIQDLENYTRMLEKNLDRYPRNQQQIDNINYAIKAFKDGRFVKGKSDGTVTAEDEGRELNIYTSSTKYLSDSYNDKEGRRKWYQVKISCFPNRRNPYCVMIRNAYAFIKEDPVTKLTEMNTEGVKWDVAKMYLTEGEWLHVVREMKDNMENARLCFYTNARKQDVQRRFANRTAAN